MSETDVVTVGSKIKRGAIVVGGEATIEYPEKKEKDKNKPSPLVKYQCPDRCLQPENPDNPGAKRRVAKVWVQRGGDEHYAGLLECPNCQKRLVFVPGKRSSEE